MKIWQRLLAYSPAVVAISAAAGINIKRRAAPAWRHISIYHRAAGAPRVKRNSPAFNSVHQRARLSAPHMAGIVPLYL